MELDAKPIETNIVLVNDKILMAVLGAENIKPVHIFLTGWPNEAPEYNREPYMAYRKTDDVMRIVNSFGNQQVKVDLKAYMNSYSELELILGTIHYSPNPSKDKDNG